MFSGALEIAAAIRLRKEINGEIWLILSGLLSVVLGVVVTWMLLTRPVESFLALGWLIGIYAAVFGVMMILLGLRLRRRIVRTVRPSMTLPHRQRLEVPCGG